MKELKLYVEEFVTADKLKALLDKYEFGDDPDEIAFIFGQVAYKGEEELIKHINKKGMSLADIEGKIKKSLNTGE